jgi:hypothetical protein
VSFAFLFKPCLYGVALVAKALEPIAHPFVPVLLVRDDVVNVMGWCDLS